MPLTARRSESIAAHSQHYNVVLEMRDRGGQVVASDVFVTSKGTDRHVFMVTSPRSAQGPFSWTVSIQSSPKTGTLDLQESFEGRERGLDRAPFYPWFSFAFSEFNNARILAEGINREGTYPAINQSAFLVVANPPNPGKFSGFGLVVGTGEWALPADKRRWTNYTFSFDFREKTGCLASSSCKSRTPPENGSSSRSLTLPRGWLGRFGVAGGVRCSSESPGFDPNHARDFVLNIRTLRTNAIYTAYFDNARFTGP